MRTVALTGDSHLGAMKRAYDVDPASYEGVRFFPLGSGGAAPRKFHASRSDGTVATFAKTWTNRVYPLAELGADRMSAVYVVSLPLNTSRIHRDYGWQTHVPWQFKREEAEIPLSAQAVEALIDQDSGETVRFMADLKAIGLNVVAIEAPRTFGNANYMKPVRREVVQYVERAYRTRVRSRLEALEIPVIDQPPETITAAGMTSLDYKHEKPADVHHANIVYGRLALDSVMAFVRALPE